MTARIIRGNALALPLPDDSVDLVVTSPPYFGLRSYQDAGEHYDGQIGAEATPAEFVDALIAATTEMVRVLKPSGSIWVNLGDKYAGGGGYKPDSPANAGSNKHNTMTTYRKSDRNFGMGQKSLIGVPWRYALRCIDDLGLILRAEVIWSKPNGLPESVTDRVRRSHETWFHFTLNPRYYSAVDEIREPHGDTSWIGRTPTLALKANADRGDAGQRATTANPLGKLPGSVWSIPTQPLKVPAELGIDHFAAFPMEWPRRIIQGWSPAGVCVDCGEGRRPTVDKDRQPTQRTHNGHGFMSPDHGGRDSLPHRTLATITGYACACPEPTAPTTPGVVLDPFGGTGTTALVAKALGRDGISVDMSADYCRLATWRTNDPAQIARATQGPKPRKPAKQAKGQEPLDLLDLGGAA